MSKNVEIKDRVSPVLEGFNEEEIIKAMRAGIRRTAAAGQREIKQEYKKLGIKRSPKAKYDKAEKGIRGYAMKNAIDMKFTIMPKRKGETDGSFLLRWIEKGTSGRQNKKGYNRGTVKARPFFKPALNRIKNYLGDEIEKEFIKALQKIKDKRG